MIYNFPFYRKKDIQFDNRKSSEHTGSLDFNITQKDF